MPARLRFTPSEIRERFNAVCRVVCTEYKLSRRSLTKARTQGKTGAVFARHVAMYLLHVERRVPQADVARLFGGRSPGTVRNACAQIEEARDDDKLDVRLDQLDVLISRRLGWSSPKE